jgi:hypothetical protein
MPRSDMKKPKLMVIGYARHGKDSICNILRDLYGFSFVSSSYFVGECAVRPWLEAKGITYPTMELCYADRIHHRSDWFDAISAYNGHDPARLGRELFAQYDIYCGLRNRREFDALKAEKAFDVCFWVDRSEHVPPENISSNTLDFSVADYIIDNNGDLEQLKCNVIIAVDRAIDDGKLVEFAY